MATITPNNVILGPANLWYGVFGATEPALTNAALIIDPAGWAFVGATSGGVTWEEVVTLTKVQADQVIDPITARPTGRTITIATNLLEPTVANLALARNNLGTVTVGTGITTVTAGQPNAATPSIFAALLVDGWAPLLSGGGSARRRAIFRKCLNDPKITQSADPTKPSMWALSMEAYYVSSTIDPWISEDQTA